MVSDGHSNLLRPIGDILADHPPRFRGRKERPLEKESAVLRVWIEEQRSGLCLVGSSFTHLVFVI